MTARSLLLGSSAYSFALLVVAAGSGCGGGSGGSGGGGTGGALPEGLCFQDPLACADGTVCAFDDENGKRMSCLPAGKSGNGDTCQNVAEAPECGEGLACLQLKGADAGTCTPFCDGAEDCKGGLECAQITTDGGAKFFACTKL